MTDREISLPFRLDGQGRIATTSDPVDQAKQHVTSYLLTRTGERIMRPDFGTPIRDFVFENLDPLQFQLLTTRIGERAARDLRNVTIERLQATEDSDTAALRLTVEFALSVGAGQGEVRSTTINMGGATT